MGKDEKLTIRISENLKEEIQRLAEADRRTVAGYLRLVLSEHVEKEKRKKKKA